MAVSISLFALTLPEGGSAKLDLPAPAGSTGVYVDAKQVEATNNNGRWIVQEKLTGSNKIEVK